MLRSFLSKCTLTTCSAATTGTLGKLLDASLQVQQPCCAGLRFSSQSTGLIGLETDKRYEVKRSQAFGPIPLAESTPKTVLTSLSTPEYAKRRHMVFDGVPYHKLPVCEIQARWNNTIVKIRDDLKKGEDVKRYCRVSCRTVGFFHAKKKTELAGEAVGQAAAERARQNNCHPHVRVIIKGIGPGRNPTMRGLLRGGMTVVSITDTTPITNYSLPQRPRKIRRV